jgi:hypothetical protein
MKKLTEICECETSKNNNIHKTKNFSLESCSLNLRIVAFKMLKESDQIIRLGYN